MTLIIIHLILSVICTLVFLVSNPISAALWLILTFLLSAATLWLFNAEFFALIYIIIYVGAIAVLFLFVIMMLDLKTFEILRNLKTAFSNGPIEKFIQWLFYIIPVWTCSFLILSKMHIKNGVSYENYVDFFDVLSNLQALGQVLFNNYLPCILIAGFILLVAIIGAVVLTLDFNNKPKIKIPSKQLSRSENFLSFFK